MCECGGVGDLLGWTSLRIVPPVVWLTALATGPGVEPGLKGFRERQRKQRKTRMWSEPPRRVPETLRGSWRGFGDIPGPGLGCDLSVELGCGVAVAE